MPSDETKLMCRSHWPSVWTRIIPIILALILPAAPLAAQTSDVDEYIYACDFGNDFDRDFDQWPDGWRRQAGAGFPKYSKLEIRPDPLAADNQVLSMNLDGGQAAVYSPAIKVNQQCSYRLRFRLNVPDDQEHPCEAWVSVSFLDAEAKSLDVYNVPAQPTTSGWLQVESPLLSVERPEIVSAVIGFHVRPTKEASLFGKASFDDVTFQELPRLVMEFSNPLHVFIAADQVRLNCRVSGMRRSDARLRFELYDELGKLLRTELLGLQDEMQVSKVAVSQDGKSQGFAVQQYEWRLVPEGRSELPVFSEGFYRLVVTLLDRDTNPLIREMTFVVLRNENSGPERLFGLSLPLSIIEHDQLALGATLQHLGVNWIKLPIWLDHEVKRQAVALGNLLQRLARLEIDVVGVLDEPPPRIFKQYWQHENGIAALTSDVDLFIEAIQPILVEWSLRIDRWQVGGDGDTGIAENSATFGRLQKIKEHFRKYGDQTKIGLPWSWLQQQAPADQQYWDFQSLAANPPLTKPEMEFHCKKLKEQARCESYIAMQPLSSQHYDLATRVQEICLQMIEAKRLGVHRTFVPAPFDPYSGLFQAGNNPTEILLPWRTLAIHLNGAEYLGQIQFPNGSVNHWFSKNGEAFMFTWNTKPTVETLYLGKRVEMTDLWGRTLKLEEVDGIQSFTTDQWPRFLRGLDLSVALIRLSLRFDRKSLDSISYERQPLKLSFQNQFPHGVSGNIILSNPELMTSNVKMPFHVGRGEVSSSNAPVQIRAGALTKQHLMRVDFKMTSEEVPSFSAWQSMHVGADDVEFATRQRLEKNRFIIMITLINRSPGPVTYTVNLTVPERKATNITFYDVQPGQISKPIIIHNVEPLIGKMLTLRATDEKRTMNYQIKVE